MERSTLCSAGRVALLGLSLCALSVSVLSSPVGAQTTPPSALPQLPAAEEAATELQPAEEAPTEGSGEEVESDEKLVLAVLPFRVHSARSLGYLTESLADLLAERLEASGELEVVDSSRVREALESEPRTELSDLELRRLAGRLGAQIIVTGSLTQLAGRFSLDLRVTPSDPISRSQTLVFTAESEEELIGRLAEFADRVFGAAAGSGPLLVSALEIQGGGEFELELRTRLQTRPGERFDPAVVREDQARLEEHPSVASVTAESERTGEGMVVRFRIVRSEMIFGEVTPEGGDLVTEIRVRGNQRIEADAIRSRIRTKVGEPLRRSRLAADVRDVYGLGFFRNIQVYAEDRPEGIALIFAVEENPVIRQISITGNDDLDSDKIRDQLTLTTGSTLDYPLLHENRERIEALYRAEGYYLADVSYQLESLNEGSIAVDFEVEENEKLKLREIAFTGNEAFTDKELQENFATKTWKFYSYVTKYLDNSGTYSEPIFGRDLRELEKIYTDAGYLQADIGAPEVDASERGLVVTVAIEEGTQYSVGRIDVSGDDSIDIDALRARLRLSTGAVFNRSHLTEDVDALQTYYTDRGFFFAKVEPRTSLSREERSVDIDFAVEKGPLYFIRHIDISGNTATIDKVVRREMRLVEGQLYSARAVRVSNIRARGLGFFEDVAFEPRPTDDPSQLDMDVRVVERPTGSFSFGAGFSSQDRFVLTASLSETNLFGHGYAVSLSADIGGSTQRYFLSLSDPYFLGSEFSLGVTFFSTDVTFVDFEQEQRGLDINLGHALREDNTARGFLRYAYASRGIRQPTLANASAPIFRELLQGNETSSLIGLSFRSDTRDDRLAPTSGTLYGATVEYAGLGGFANYLRLEGRFSWYLAAPGWLIDRSAFVFSTRLGYVFPFNTVDDYDLRVGDALACTAGLCVNAGNLDQIDTDIRLPLTERYFLGGIGPFQLRGYEARSIGPRRPILRISPNTPIVDENDARIFSPVGTQLEPLGPLVPNLVAICNDVAGSGNQGNGNGRCNRIGDKNISDFDDIRETDVIGGSSFISTSFEYRFPISEQVGLQGVLFMDMGNSFSEGENLFDVRQWRYGYGAGVLWFSPFGPLQVVLGFPIGRLPIEDSPVFEFSVGAFGQ